VLSVSDELQVLAGSFLEGLLRHGFVEASEQFLEWWTEFANEELEEDEDA